MSDKILKIADRFYLFSTSQITSVNTSVMKNTYSDILNLVKYTDRDLSLAIDAFTNNQLTLVRNHLGNLDRTLEQIAGACAFFISGMRKTAGFFDFFKRKPKEQSFEEKHKKAISSFRAGIWSTINNSKSTLYLVKSAIKNLKDSLGDEISFANQVASLREICLNHHKMLQVANKEYFLPLLNLKSTVEYQANVPTESNNYEIPSKFEPAGVPIIVNKPLPLDVKLKQEHKDYKSGVGKEYRFAPCPCGSGKSFVGCHGEDFDKIRSIILKNKEKDLSLIFNNQEYVKRIMDQYKKEDSSYWSDAKEGSKEKSDFEKAEKEYFRLLNLQAAKEAERKAAQEAAKEEQKRQETIAIRKDKRSRLRDFYDSVFGRKAV